MTVFICKLDNPTDKYSWWFRDVDINKLNDIEKITGVCSEHCYAAMYSDTENDSAELVSAVLSHINNNYKLITVDTVKHMFCVTESLYKGV